MIQKIVIMFFFIGVICSEIALADAEAKLTPMVAILANPTTFAGREVVVDGFLAFRLEDNALYLNREAFHNYISTSALWLEISPDDLSKLKKYERNYIRIAGTFDSKNTGHRGLFVGALSKLRLISELHGESFLCRLTRIPFFCYE